MNHTYAFSVHAGREFERAVDSVMRALKKQGFGIVSDIDMQAIFKEKLALDERPYRILGACNPMLANQALRADPHIGLLLPCNVVVRQDRDGGVEVVFTAPEALLALANDDNLTSLGMEVRHRLEKVSEIVLTDLALAS
jgi:uncharacterized protein (DUF302 family)